MMQHGWERMAKQMSRVMAVPSTAHVPEDIRGQARTKAALPILQFLLATKAKHKQALYNRDQEDNALS